MPPARELRHRRAAVIIPARRGKDHVRLVDRSVLPDKLVLRGERRGRTLAQGPLHGLTRERRARPTGA